MKFFSLVLVLPFVTLSLVKGSTYYVSPGGNDTGSGSISDPWKTPSYAAGKLVPGDTLVFRNGMYFLSKQFGSHQSGKPDRPVVYTVYPGEQAVLDASQMELPVVKRGEKPGLYHQGALQLTGVQWVVIKNLTIQNSPFAGIGLWNSSHIDILNVKVHMTFAPGICAWPGCKYIRILGCTVTEANSHAMNRDTLSYPKRKEAPHEAISICAIHFEVAWNHVHHCNKEGIDVKETAAHGKVHHNYIHHVARQGLYVDSWFGKLEDIELFENVVHDCVTGFAVSAEGGPVAENIRVHHNLFYDNIGCGIFFSRWGRNNLRSDILIEYNTVVHCGHGDGSGNFWLTAGGCYLYTNNLHAIKIANNVFSDNWPFQIGITWLLNHKDSLENRNIRIEGNLIDHRARDVRFPVYLAWPQDSVFRYDGISPTITKVNFVAPAEGNFAVKGIRSNKKPGGSAGAFPQIISKGFWWKESFPPVF